MQRIESGPAGGLAEAVPAGTPSLTSSRLIARDRHDATVARRLPICQTVASLSERGNLEMIDTLDSAKNGAATVSSLF